MKKIFFTLLIAVLVLVLASPAVACRWLSPAGDPYEGTSWSQDFDYFAGGKFDALELFITSGSYSGSHLIYGSDGMRDFTGGWASSPLPSWSSSYVNFHYAFASGDPLRYIQFTVDFTGDMSEPISFDLLAWNEGEFVEGYQASRSSPWQIVLINEDDLGNYNRSIPEPSTMLLLGSGLVGLLAFRKRFRKK